MRGHLVVNADARDLAAVRDGTIHAVVTSPPYWQLRDYKVAPSIWGGGPCRRHVWGASWSGVKRTGGTESSGFPAFGKSEKLVAAHVDRRSHDGGRSVFCQRCGAWRGCLGQEPSPELYVEHLVGIFRELRRVLRNDGTVWLNLGDTYVLGKPKEEGEATSDLGWANRPSYRRDRAALGGEPHRVVSTLKPGDLCGIPWRVFLALQEDGWYGRSDTIWEKPNPQPESVAGWRWERHRRKIKPGDVPRQGDPGGNGNRPHAEELGDCGAALWEDCPGCRKCRRNGGLLLRQGSWRPTRSHEYLFLLAKSADYYADGEAMREMLTVSARRRGTPVDVTTSRNVRSVWKITTSPFPGAHFATFPPELARRCIAASTSAHGVCRSCGAPWARVVERGAALRPVAYGGKWGSEDEQSRGRRLQENLRAHRAAGGEHNNPFPSAVTRGWRPTCRCRNAGEAAPAIVFDPFSGAGTTGLEARRLGRRFLGTEIALRFCRMGHQRIGRDAPLFSGVLRIGREVEDCGDQVELFAVEEVAP